MGRESTWIASYLLLWTRFVVFLYYAARHRRNCSKGAGTTTEEFSGAGARIGCLRMKIYRRFPAQSNDVRTRSFPLFHVFCRQMRSISVGFSSYSRSPLSLSVSPLPLFSILLSIFLFSIPFSSLPLRLTLYLLLCARDDFSLYLTLSLSPLPVFMRRYIYLFDFLFFHYSVYLPHHFTLSSCVSTLFLYLSLRACRLLFLLSVSLHIYSCFSISFSTPLHLFHYFSISRSIYVHTSTSSFDFAKSSSPQLSTRSYFVLVCLFLVYSSLLSLPLSRRSTV